MCSGNFTPPTHAARNEPEHLGSTLVGAPCTSPNSGAQHARAQSAWPNQEALLCSAGDIKIFSDTCDAEYRQFNECQPPPQSTRPTTTKPSTGATKTPAMATNKLTPPRDALLRIAEFERAGVAMFRCGKEAGLASQYSSCRTDPSSVCSSAKKATVSMQGWNDAFEDYATCISFELAHFSQTRSEATQVEGSSETLSIYSGLSLLKNCIKYLFLPYLEFVGVDLKKPAASSHKMPAASRRDDAGRCSPGIPKWADYLRLYNWYTKIAKIVLSIKYGGNEQKAYAEHVDAFAQLVLHVICAFDDSGGDCSGRLDGVSQNQEQINCPNSTGCSEISAQGCSACWKRHRICLALLHRAKKLSKLSISVSQGLGKCFLTLARLHSKLWLLEGASAGEKDSFAYKRRYFSAETKVLYCYLRAECSQASKRNDKGFEMTLSQITERYHRQKSCAPNHKTHISFLDELRESSFEKKCTSNRAAAECTHLTETNALNMLQRQTNTADFNSGSPQNGNANILTFDDLIKLCAESPGESKPNSSRDSFCKAHVDAEEISSLYLFNSFLAHVYSGNYSKYEMQNLLFELTNVNMIQVFCAMFLEYATRQDEIANNLARALLWRIMHISAVRGYESTYSLLLAYFLVNPTFSMPEMSFSDLYPPFDALVLDYTGEDAPEGNFASFKIMCQAYSSSLSWQPIATVRLLDRIAKIVMKRELFIEIDSEIICTTYPFKGLASDWIGLEKWRFPSSSYEELVKLVKTHGHRIGVRMHCDSEVTLNSVFTLDCVEASVFAHISCMIAPRCSHTYVLDTNVLLMKSLLRNKSQLRDIVCSPAVVIPSAVAYEIMSIARGANYQRDELVAIAVSVQALLKENFDQIFFANKNGIRLRENRFGRDISVFKELDSAILLTASKIASLQRHVYPGPINAVSLVTSDKELQSRTLAENIATLNFAEFMGSVVPTLPKKNNFCLKSNGL